MFMLQEAQLLHQSGHIRLVLPISTHIHRAWLTYSLPLETCKCIQILTVFVLVDNGPLGFSEYLKEKKKE